MKKILAMVFTMLITLTVVNTPVLASETKNVAVKGNVSNYENGESVSRVGKNWNATYSGDLAGTI